MWCSNDPIFWPQMLVLTSGCFYSFGFGISLAHHNTALSPNANDIRVTIDQASWIESIKCVSALTGFIIFSPLIQILGRKPVNIFIQICIIIGWLFVYCSNSVTMLRISEIIQGFNIAGIFVIEFTISEITHRRRRGVFLTTKITALSFGSLLYRYALSYNWQQISQIAIIPHTFTILIILLCPESPSFYAIKGKFSDCEKSFLWYHGDSDDSKRELKLLISSQIERRNIDIQRNKFSLVKKLLHKDFLIPFMVATLASMSVVISGRNFLLGYVNQIMIELTGNKHITIFSSLLADGLIILASCISIVVINKFKRRTILFKFGAVSIALMYSVCLFEALKVTLLTKFTNFLIVLHNFISTFSLIPVFFTILMEIFPLEYRGVGSFTTGIFFTISYTVVMKIIPILMKRIGIGGIYFIFSIFVTISLVILYYILPETKDKSLQEIKNEVKGIKRSEVEIELILSNEASKNLL